MKTKVLIVDQADFLGGAEYFNLDLINNLDQEKFDIHLLSSGNPDYHNKIKVHLNSYAYPLPKLKNRFFKYFHLLKSAWLLRTIVKREKIEIIHTNTIRTHIIAAVTKKLFKLNCKLVWFVHDFTFPQNILRKLIATPDQILVCAATVKQDLVHKTSNKHTNKIDIVYNGVIPKKINPQDPVAKKLHTFLKNGTTKETNKRYTIGIIGRLDPWKGQDLFIEAASKVIPEYSNTEFQIIGTSSPYDQATIDFEKKLHKLVKKHQLANKVKFLGYVPDLDQAIQKIDLIVHASSQAEPFGRVIIEAMNWGKPVIAPDTGGPKEIIANNKDGYLIQPNNAKLLAKKTLEIINKPQVLPQLSQNARLKVKQKFNLKTQVQKIENHWLKLIEN